MQLSCCSGFLSGDNIDKSQLWLCCTGGSPYPEVTSYANRAIDLSHLCCTADCAAFYWSRCAVPSTVQLVISGVIAHRVSDQDRKQPTANSTKLLALLVPGGVQY